LVARYSDAKTRYAALMAEVQHNGTMLANLGEAMRQVNFCTEYWSGRPDGYARNRTEIAVREYPSHEKVRALVDDLKATASELRELRRLMTEANVSLD